MSSITAVVLMKNEENRIQRCLNALVDVFSLVLVYDTGSSDSSTDKVLEYPHSKVQLTHGSWDDSFANARNRALNFVNTDWAIFIDADEELLSSKKQINSELKNLSQYLRLNAFCPKILLEDGSIVANNTRIVRVNSDAKFVGRVHEYVPVEYLISCDIRFRHTGYSIGNRPTKELRNLTLLRKQIIEDRKNPRWLYFAASNYSSIEIDVRLSIIDHLLSGVLCKNVNAHYYSGCISMALRLSLTIGDISRLNGYIELGYSFSPSNIDVVFYKHLARYIQRKASYHKELDLILKDLSIDLPLEKFDNNFESYNSIQDLKNLILFSRENFEAIETSVEADDFKSNLLNTEINKFRGGING